MPSFSFANLGPRIRNRLFYLKSNLAHHLLFVGRRARRQVRLHGPLPTLAVVTIMKNEGPYILEFIAWHRLQGIRDFFIYDNASQDGTSELLAGLARAGVLRHIPFPGHPLRGPQLSAYLHAAQTFGHLADWFAFIDADEFLTAERDQPALPRWLESLSPKVGAVGVQWRVYGSSGRIDPGTGTIHERFTQRAHDDWRENACYKSIVRMVDWRGVFGHPHRFRLARGQRFVDTLGADAAIGSLSDGVLSRRVWGAARLDHFLIKSLREYELKKFARGRATVVGGKRPEDFFRYHDRNDLYAPVASETLRSLKAEIETLRSLLDLPPPARDLDLQLDQLGTDVARRAKT